MLNTKSLDLLLFHEWTKLYNQTAVLPKLKPFKAEFDDVALQNQRADGKKKIHSSLNHFECRKLKLRNDKWNTLIFYFKKMKDISRQRTDSKIFW